MRKQSLLNIIIPNIIIVLIFSILFCSAQPPKPKGVSYELKKASLPSKPAWAILESDAPKFDGFKTFVGISDEFLNENDAIGHALTTTLRAFAYHKGLQIAVDSKVLTYDSGTASTGINRNVNMSSEVKVVAEEFVKGLEIVQKYTEFYHRFYGGDYLDCYYKAYVLVKFPVK